MKITNNQNLPQAMVDLVESGVYEPKLNSFSATTLLNPVQQTKLTREHWEEIEKDVSEMVNMVLGTATHSLIEKMDKTGLAELYLKQPIKDGYYLTGKCDLYDKKNETLVDWKTATCWKVIYNDFKDWRLQGLIYAWLLIKEGKPVKRLQFHALLKDWTARDLRTAQLKGDFYPPTQIYTWEYNVTIKDLLEIEEFIKQRFNELLSDDFVPCSDEDTWYTGNKYAVYKKPDAARADRVFDNEDDANKYIAEKGGVLVKRVGEHRRCQDYCDVCKWCPQYNAEKEE